MRSTFRSAPPTLDDEQLGVVVLAERPGIAAETAARFALAGHLVVIGARGNSFAGTEAQRLRARGAGVFTSALDVSDCLSVSDFAATTLYLVGRVDCLILGPELTSGRCRGETGLVGIQHLAAQLVYRGARGGYEDLTVITFTPQQGQWKARVSAHSMFLDALNKWVELHESTCTPATDTSGGCCKSDVCDRLQTQLDDWQQSMQAPATHRGRRSSSGPAYGLPVAIGVGRDGHHLDEEENL